MQSQFGKLLPKACSQRTTLTLWGTNSWSHFNLCTLLKMSPSIPWWTIGLTCIGLCCPLPAWSHPCSSTLLIMSPSHMGLCCLAPSVETGYHRGVVTNALKGFFFFLKSILIQVTILPVAFDVICVVKRQFTPWYYHQATILGDCFSDRQGLNVIGAPCGVTCGQIYYSSQLGSKK